MSNNKPELKLIRELDSRISDMKGLLDNMLGVIFDRSGDLVIDAIKRNPHAKRSIGLFLEVAKELREYFPEENEELISPINNIDEEYEKEGVYELYQYILSKSPSRNRLKAVNEPEIELGNILPVLEKIIEGLREFYSPDFSRLGNISNNILLHSLFNELKPGFDKILEDMVHIGEILEPNHSLNLEGFPSKNEITRRNFYSFTK